MAKKPKIAPTTEFIRNSADIVSQLMLSLYTPIARLAGVEAFEAARDRVCDLMNLPTSAYTMNDFREVFLEIANTVKSAGGNSDFNTRFKKDRNGYTFTLSKKTTQGGQLGFATQIKNFPGASIRNFREQISASDKASIVWAMMAAAGFTFTPNGEKFIAYYTPLVVTDRKSAQKAVDADPVEMAVDDTTGIQKFIGMLEKRANQTHTSTMQNGAFTSSLQYSVEVTTMGPNVLIDIYPMFDISISEMLIPFMSETEDKNSVDYLVYAWMQHAIGRASNSVRGGTSNAPAVDLRVTSKKLRAVSDRFQAAKPRLNANGFCIDRNGIPMYVPSVDETARFMQDHSGFSTDEDGYLNYESVASKWQNKIVMTDWFNDVIVYTSPVGSLQVYRMLGYIPLDPTSEYVWLNTAVNARRVSPILTDLGKMVDLLVTRDEAQAALPPQFSGPNSYNAGQIRQSFGLLITTIRTVNGNPRPIQPSDPDFEHESTSSALIKHLFGIELEEVSDVTAGLCAHISAYLRVLSTKRKEISLDIMKRLSGIEYFVVMGKALTTDAWSKMRVEAKAEQERRKPASKLLSEIDIPNLDAGGNLKGYMPHQVRILSDRASGSNSSLTGVSPGGGKTLLQLGDILMELERNPTWRPLLITKPRLVKGIISEFNFFSKGKVNVVSIRLAQLRYLKTALKMQNALDVINWVKSFPPNTVFVCGYTDFSRFTSLYDDLDVPSRVMLEDVALPQFLHLLRIIGFDNVKLDESHIIKNMRSRRSVHTYSILAQAQSKMELSGTIASNTVIDLVGQAYGLNPMIFGRDEEDFKERYNLSGGLIKSDESSFKLNSRLRKFTQMSSATKEDWSFILPDLYDKFLAPQLTPKQAEFYALLMKKAEAELTAKVNNGENSSSNDDDDDDTDDADDGGDARFQMQVDASIAEAEMFLVAPDSNDQYMRWSKNPTGLDLVSPMVKAIDEKLAEIYANRAEDHSNNKSAVFGIHKVASAHFMKYTKFKDVCLHYRAGNEDIIRQFKTNPDKWILVADSTSIREGENLQMLSYIFDMQATWAPGDFEQLISRMYRPDPKGQFNKDLVTHYWITPTHGQNLPTIATVKLARMISKAVSIARFKYDGDPRWKMISSEFNDLDLLSMNLKTIFESNHNDLAPYYNAYSKFVAWERDINQDKRKSIAEMLQEANPGVQLIDAQGRVLDRNLFTKLVMREAKSTRTLAGSKRVFTPWERGAVPADMHDMSLAILGSDAVEVGDYVVTEYGPGIVQAVGDNQLLVELYGRKKAKIDRSRIAVPKGEGVAKLNTIITSPTAWAGETWSQTIQAFGVVDPEASLAPKGRKVPGAKPITPVTSLPLAGKIDPNQFKKKVAPPPVVEEEPEEEDDQKVAIEDIYVFIINGMPAISIVDAPSGVENLGWMPVAPAKGVTFNSWASADKFMKLLTAKFAISNAKMDMLDAEMDEFRDGRALKLTRRVTNAQSRNFFMTNHRKLAASSDGRERVDPYWVAINGVIYLAFSHQSHSQKVFAWLKMIQSKNSTMIKPLKEISEQHINVFSTLNEAAQDLKALAEAFDIPADDVRKELRAIKEQLMALRKKKISPMR